MQAAAKRMEIQALREPNGEILFGGVDGNFVDIDGDGHDVAFDMITRRIERFAHGGIPNGTVVGEGVWKDDGRRLRLEEIDYAPGILARYGRKNVTEDDVELEATPYEEE